MPICLTLGGVTTEMAIEDNTEALTSLITILTAQGVQTNQILEDLEGHSVDAINVQKATLLGIEIISDSENGSLIQDIDEE